jgi:hypothetical protein
MNTESHIGWPVRLVWSSVFSTAVITISGLSLLTLTSTGASRMGDTVSSVVSIPLLPGIGFVAAVFGTWRTFHQGQIVWIPIISILFDSAFAFIIWEFVHRRTLPKGDAQNTLKLNG